MSLYPLQAHSSLGTKSSSQQALSRAVKQDSTASWLVRQSLGRSDMIGNVPLFFGEPLKAGHAWQVHLAFPGAALTVVLMQAASFRVYARDIEKEAEGESIKLLYCHAAIRAHVDCACDMHAGFLAHKGQQKLGYQVLALLWGAAAIAGELTLPLASVVEDHPRHGSVPTPHCRAPPHSCTKL